MFHEEGFRVGFVPAGEVVLCGSTVPQFPDRRSTKANYRTTIVPMNEALRQFHAIPTPDPWPAALVLRAGWFAIVGAVNLSRCRVYYNDDSNLCVPITDGRWTVLSYLADQIFCGFDGAMSIREFLHATSSSWIDNAFYPCGNGTILRVSCTTDHYRYASFLHGQNQAYCWHLCQLETSRRMLPDRGGHLCISHAEFEVCAKALAECG